MSESFFVIDEAKHNALVQAAYQHAGFSEQESLDAAQLAALASKHGIRTHNALKALHLDHLFGSGRQDGEPGCVPGAEIEVKPSRFAASEVWDAHKKLGQSVAFAAIDRCIELADQYGIGQVAVDNAFHYLWGGGYVMEAANRGYIAYTNCTAALAEVAPFGGRAATLGTNPHSWGLPTTEAIGFPIVIDWATSVVAMGRVQQLKREGLPVPPNAALDAEGNFTTQADDVVALVPFGAHKGYGLSLINELTAGLIGGSLPTLRCRGGEGGGAEGVGGQEKHTPAFYFQVIHPDAISGGAFAQGRDQKSNIKAVVEDILGHGNEGCLLPGQIEHNWAKRCQEQGGLLFSEAEVVAFNELADACGHPRWEIAELASAGA